MTTHNKTNSGATAQRAVASGPLVRRTIYRHFKIVERDGKIRILSACGDTHPADSLSDAHQQIDSWYREGSVEW
jgi:hypothetical protein